MNNLHNNVVELAATAERTSTLTGSGVDLSDYTGPVNIILTSSAGAGTTPTLNVKLQESAASGSGYEDVSGAVFAEVDGSADSTQMITLQVDSLKQYVRVVGTIAGTDPVFSFGVVAVARQQAGMNTSQAV